MEPVFMVLGQSAATAAVFAIEAGTDVQSVPYEKLRARLLADGQVLEYAAPPKAPERAPALDRRRLSGILVDDNDAVVTGEWETSHAVGPFVGTGYRHDGAAGKGAKSVRYEAKLPAPGRYEVRFSYTPNANRSKAVPVSVRHAGGEAKVSVDETKAPTHESAFVVLGTWTFEAGTATVEVTTTGTTGHVVVDAVAFVAAP
jgi:hypothetical protein